MIKDFKTISAIAGCLSKSYAKEVFELLNEYKDISASEAASRLGLHIQTIQDFFDSLAECNVLSKTEINEGKRPYYRYTYKKSRIEISYDLKELSGSAGQTEIIKKKIREKKDSRVQFSTARSGKFFSSLTLMQGGSREAKVRKISLTKAQGEFLFNLPFPEAKALSIEEIIRKSNIDAEFTSEILNIVQELINQNVIEIEGS